MNEKQGDIHYSVIAGELKGRRISAPDLGVTRPPLTRLRRSIFDFLNPYLDGAAYLDLFSGTGSYLFEAISRGAVKAVGVEMESALAESINHYAAKYGVGQRLICRCEDVFEAIPEFSRTNERFDIVMIAPPQYKRLIDKTLASLASNPVLTKDGIVICQHDTSERDIDFGIFQIEQQRKYGNTTFSVVRVG